MPGSTKHVEKMNSHGAFGPRTDHNSKTVKTDRASSANSKLPGNALHIKPESAMQQEYNHPLEGIRIQAGPTHNIREKVPAK